MENVQLAQHVSSRRVAAGDEGLLSSLFNTLSEETKAIFSGLAFNREHAKQWVEAAGNDQTVRRFIVFNHEGEDGVSEKEALGMVWLFRWNQKVVWLGIMIADRFQGQGYGRMLIQFAIEYARTFNKGGILLTTHKNNHRAQTLYKRFDFQVIGEDPRGEVLMILNFLDESEGINK